MSEEDSLACSPQAISAVSVKIMGGKKRQTRREEETDPGCSGKQRDFDVRLIPEFSGDGTVSEWLDKVQLICDLRGVSDLTEVIPLRLTGGAFAVYQQLPATDRRDVDKIKSALIAAFSDDSFAAYEKFMRRRLNMNESADVFLADLRRLSTLFGGISDQGLGCAFLAGLPEAVRQGLRTGCRVESLQLDQLLARARAVLKDTGDFEGAAAGIGAHSTSNKASIKPRATQVAKAPGATTRRCFICDGENHLAKHCFRRKTAVQRRDGFECFRCGGPHLARVCPGNRAGEDGSAPASSPDGH